MDDEEVVFGAASLFFHRLFLFFHHLFLFSHRLFLFFRPISFLHCFPVFSILSHVCHDFLFIEWSICSLFSSFRVVFLLLLSVLYSLLCHLNLWESSSSIVFLFWRSVFRPYFKSFSFSFFRKKKEREREMPASLLQSLLSHHREEHPGKEIRREKQEERNKKRNEQATK